ncbi:hypothetical protein, partial [Escherichia coli]|uniref:hypothetical protein n=1 Tax=Escherichia coli TaxID=562 RepID=UPI003CE50B41
GLKALDGSFKYVRKRLAQQPAELDAQAVQSYKVRLAAEDERRKAAEAKQDYNQMFVAPTVVEESPAWRVLAKILIQI